MREGGKEGACTALISFGNCIQWTPLGQKKVSYLERCLYVRTVFGGKKGGEVSFSQGLNCSVLCTVTIGIRGVSGGVWGVVHGNQKVGGVKEKGSGEEKLP